MAYPAPSLHIPMLTETLDWSNTTGVELINDSDMSAVGTSDWSAGNDAVLSKVSNGAGGQALRVAWGGPGNNPYAFQSPLTVGAWVRVMGAARSDGNRFPFLRAGQGATNPNWQGTNNTDFQNVDYEVLVAALNDARIGTIATTLEQGYTEWDYLSVQELDIRSLDVIGSKHMRLTDGKTAALLPPQLSDKGFDMSNDNHYGIIPGGVSNVSNITVAFYVDNLPKLVNQDYLGAWNGTNLYFLSLYAASLNQVWFMTGGSGGGQAARFAWNPNDIGRHLVVGTYDGTNTSIWIDGIKGTNATIPLAPNYNSQDILFSRRYDISSFHAGNHYDFKLWNGTALTHEQINELWLDTQRDFARYHI